MSEFVLCFAAEILDITTKKKSAYLKSDMTTFPRYGILPPMMVRISSLVALAYMLLHVQFIVGSRGAGCHKGFRDAMGDAPTERVVVFVLFVLAHVLHHCVIHDTFFWIPPLLSFLPWLLYASLYAGVGLVCVGNDSTAHTVGCAMSLFALGMMLLNILFVTLSKCSDPCSLPYMYKKRPKTMHFIMTAECMLLLVTAVFAILSQAWSNISTHCNVASQVSVVALAAFVLLLMLHMDVYGDKKGIVLIEGTQCGQTVSQLAAQVGKVRKTLTKTIALKAGASS